VAAEHVHGRSWAGFGSQATWPGLEETRAAGLDWWYGDHAYFKRFRFYRVTRNAYQHHGVGTPDWPRWKALNLEIAPWQNGGRHVLVCPPSAVWAELIGFDAAQWFVDVMETLRAATDRPIYVRTRNKANYGVPLAQDLVGCHCLVTHSSNAAVDALLAGVPVICTSACAARVMGRADPAMVEEPIRHRERVEWAAVLAGQQWAMDEIKTGDCWRRVGDAAIH
jgi:hypothetical protein